MAIGTECRPHLKTDTHPVQATIRLHALHNLLHKSIGKPYKLVSDSYLKPEGPEAGQLVLIHDSDGYLRSSDGHPSSVTNNAEYPKARLPVYL